MKFKQMHKLIPEQESKNFRIVHHTATKEDVSIMKLRDKIQGTGEFDNFKEGVYLELRNREAFFNNIVMSDTPMELETNLEVIKNSSGDVLIGGLGIGAILLLIQEKPEVKSIIVIERYKEIIDMVKPHLPLNKKVKIIEVDIFDWFPEDSNRFNTIYFDIWNNICSDNVDEMKTLKRGFRRFLNKNGWIGCWREEDCRRIR